MGVVMAGFIVVGKDFFALWMPASDSTLLYTLSVLGMLSFFFIGTTQCMEQAALLANKLRLPVMVSFGKNVAGLLIIWLLCSLFRDAAMYVIAAVSPITMVLYDLFFNVPYSAKCINVEKWFFYKNKIKFIADTGILTVLFCLIKWAVLRRATWSCLMLCIAVCAIVGLAFNFFFFLSRDKRRRILSKFIHPAA